MQYTLNTRQHLLQLSLISVSWFHTWHSITCGERKAFWSCSYPTEPTVPHHVQLFCWGWSIQTYESRSPVMGALWYGSRNVNIPPTIHVSSLTDEPFMRQKVSWGPDCDAIKEIWVCSYVTVCVCMCEEKLRFLSRWLGSILAFPSSCPIQVLGQKSSSLLLININIILYYPLPLTFSTA